DQREESEDDKRGGDSPDDRHERDCVPDARGQRTCRRGGHRQMPALYSLPAEGNGVTDILPGQLVYIVGVSILDAALLSWLALLWYRRSVRRLMREGSAGTPAPPVESSQRPVLLPETTAAAGPGDFSL